MNQLQSLDTTRADAEVLLDAWDRGDLVSLHGHLRSRERAMAAADTPSLEIERCELLDGIAETMRHALAPNVLGIAGCDIEISVQLLRHLVRTN